MEVIWLKQEEREFLRIMKKLKRLNLSVILPGITFGEFSVMKAIDGCAKEKESARVSEIISDLCAAPPAISRCFKVLEGRGFILRAIDQGDRRNTRVALTKEGRSKLEESERALNSYSRAVFGGMGQEDMRRLNAYLEKFLMTSQQEMEKRQQEKEGRNEDYE